MAKVNKEYTEDFKKYIVQLILDGECTDKEASELYEVPLKNLKLWKAMILCHRAIEENSVGEKEPMTDELDLPKKMTIARAIGAVTMFRNTDPKTFGEYCRKNGITQAQVVHWESWFKKHGDDVVPERMLTERERLIKTLDKELDRKNKALAEYGEMIALSKKALAIFGPKEE